ncbi:hypothetical protein BVV19_08385 [Xanthomonas oryzae pv. oryzae]|nr:hypothetical protein BVV18_08375 [Xanthomonas oryzae pv. oryzae]AUJ07102.1 hypothetical protein BVV19_08385 [Xanthomonas oryzae pv. oryzae]
MFFGKTLLHVQSPRDRELDSKPRCYSKSGGTSVPPKSNRVDPWEYDQQMYKRRNEVERLFRRLKGYRRIFTRFEKLDVMFLGFLSFVLTVDVLRMC